MNKTIVIRYYFLQRKKKVFLHFCSVDSRPLRRLELERARATCIRHRGSMPASRVWPHAAFQTALCSCGLCGDSGGGGVFFLVPPFFLFSSGRAHSLNRTAGRAPANPWHVFLNRLLASDCMAQQLANVCSPARCHATGPWCPDTAARPGAAHQYTSSVALSTIGPRAGGGQSREWPLATIEDTGAWFQLRVRKPRGVHDTGSGVLARPHYHHACVAVHTVWGTEHCS